ncbi:MAG: cupin domain-containing protein [Candidatus Atribacteria bacterium]|nr:cupin domain-containing protein [Candidatus Atribacteria bacterium]
MKVIPENNLPIFTGGGGIMKFFIPSPIKESGQMVFGYFELGPGESHTVPGSHHFSDEVYYVIEGKMIVEGENQKTILVEEGNVLYIEAGEMHWGKNPFEETVKCVFVLVPPDFPGCRAWMEEAMAAGNHN